MSKVFQEMFGTDYDSYMEQFNAKIRELGLPELPCPIVADDDGYNQNNLAFWVVQDGELKIKEHKIMSRGRRGRHLQTFGGDGVGIYSSDDDEYTISPNLTAPEDTRRDDYSSSPLNRLLVHAALNSIGITGGAKVAVITGLPIGQYMRDGGGINQKLIDAKTKNMKTPVTVGVSKTPSADIAFHGVLPEAICGIVDWVIDDSGKPIKDPNVTRMALDIGGNTTDMAIIMPGNEVAEVKTVKFGVSHMRDGLRTLLEDKFEMTLDSISLDEAIATKTATLFGQAHDVAQEWETAVSKVLKDICGAADTFRKKFPSMREMVGFGGGVALCQDIIRKQFPQIQTVENPDGANARGALKYATFGQLERIVAELGAVTEAS